MRSHAGVATKMFQLLAAESINIQLISTSEIKISCVIARKYAELAVRALHDGFGLSLPPAERAEPLTPADTAPAGWRQTWAAARTARARPAAIIARAR